MDPVIASLTEHLNEADAGDVLGVYLFGSSVMGGLRPDSDIDVLVLTRQSLTVEERHALRDFLLRYSGRRATVKPGRPIELTALVLDDVVPWTFPPECDFLYGEWLRDQYLDRVPERHTNPDLAVLLTTVQQHADCLHGPPPQELLSPVPTADLIRSIHDSLPGLMSDLVGDERNVLLTLARMVLTVETGDIASKDAAVDWIVPSLGEPYRSVLTSAAMAYLGRQDDEWTERQGEARDTAEHLAARIHGSRLHRAERCQRTVIGTT